jgi:hypothetical protein
MNLQKIKKELEEIAGGWNGEDEKFSVGGIVYHEEDAHNAGEAIVIIERLEEILKTLGIK